jgi:hypothetical protein
MPRYIIEADLSDGCGNCPCWGEGWWCQAAGGRDIPFKDEDGMDLPDDYIPDWCPLVPEEELELAFCVIDSCDCCDEYGESCNGAFRYKEFIEEES